MSARSPLRERHTSPTFSSNKFKSTQKPLESECFQLETYSPNSYQNDQRIEISSDSSNKIVFSTAKTHSPSRSLSPLCDSLLPFHADALATRKLEKIRKHRSALVGIIVLLILLLFITFVLMIHYKNSTSDAVTSQQFSQKGECASTQCSHPSVRGRNGIVSTTHELATHVGIEVLKNGGNAFDAAAAVQFALNVVQPQSTGIGGGCFVLGYRSETKRIFAIDGREEQPSNFNSTSFCMNPACFIEGDQCDCSSGVWDFDQRITGGHPVGVPGVVAAINKMLNDFGSWKLADTLKPAIKLAREGFEMYADMYDRLIMNKERMTQFESTKKTYFPNGGEPVSTGEIFRNENLAQTFELLAQKGAKEFYEGDLARDIVDAVQTQVNKQTGLKGVMTLDDLKSYRAVYRKPLKSQYRDTTLVGFPSPSSGGLSIAQMLNLLESYEVKSFQPLSGEFLHRFIDAQDITFADRNLYMGDPDWVDVPIHGLLDKDYAKRRVDELMKVTKSARAQSGGIVPFGIPPQLKEDNYDSLEQVQPRNDAMNDDSDPQINSSPKEMDTRTKLSEMTVHRHARHLTSLQLKLNEVLSDAPKQIKKQFHEIFAPGIHQDERGTTHMVIVDKWGNIVALTTTLEENFGCGVVVPNRGFLLNNELTDFQALPFDPVSKKPFANSPSRGRQRRRTALGDDSQTFGSKRPMSSMSPTILLKATDSKAAITESDIMNHFEPYLAMGSPGGSMIIGTVLNGLVNVLDFKMCIGDAVDAPRTISQNTNVTLMETALLTEPKYQADLALLAERDFVVERLITKRPLGYIQVGVIHGKNDYEAVADSKRLPQALAEAY